MLAAQQLKTTKRLRCPLLAIAGIAAVFASPTAAQVLIQPDTAITSSEFNALNYGGGRTIDGSGLPPGFSVSSSHDAYAPGNHWTTNGSAPTDQFIRWGFNADQALDSIHIWNHQSTFPEHASNAGYDVTQFDLTLFDAVNVTLLTLNNVALAPDMATGQTFSFGSVISGIREVRFDIEAVQSSPSYTGLAEVAFSVTAVPEPSTYALMLGGLGVVAFVARRRRRLLATAAA